MSEPSEARENARAAESFADRAIDYAEGGTSDADFESDAFTDAERLRLVIARGLASVTYALLSMAATIREVESR
jgi:hypothetical protein